jgi:spore maturation protein CgeB
MGHDVKECSVYPENLIFGKFFNRIFVKIYFYIDLFLVSRSIFFRNILVRRLSNEIINFDPDLLLVTYDYLYSDQIEKLKSLSQVKIALWSPDSVATVASGRSHFMNAAYDALFFKDPFIVNNLKHTLGLNTFYLPECFNHRTHKFEGVISEKFKVDITTAGNLHSYRVAFFRNLNLDNLKITIWGFDAPSWLNSSKIKHLYMGRPIYNAEKAQVFLGAKIVINNLLISEVEGVNVRTFEAAGIGAFQLVDYRPGIEDLFKIGEEIITFSGMVDLREKINFYLSRPELRKKIADQGKIRALKEHTYEIRLKSMLKHIFE